MERLGSTVVNADQHPVDYTDLATAGLPLWPADAGNGAALLRNRIAEPGSVTTEPDCHRGHLHRRGLRAGRDSAVRLPLVAGDLCRSTAAGALRWHTGRRSIGDRHCQRRPSRIWSVAVPASAIGQQAHHTTRYRRPDADHRTGATALQRAGWQSGAGTERGDRRAAVADEPVLMVVRQQHGAVAGRTDGAAANCWRSTTAYITACSQPAS